MRGIKFIVFLLASLVMAGCSQQPASNTGSPANPTSTDKATDAIKVSASDVDAAEPAIAADSSGAIYVAYAVHNADKSADVFVQKYGTGLNADVNPERVNPAPGSARIWYGDPPSIKVGGDGAIYVAWTLKVDNGKKKGTDLMLSVSRDGGKSFEAPVKVNDDTEPASHGMHSLEIAPDGRIYMAWLDERNVKPMKASLMPKMPFAFAMMFHHTPEPVEPNADVYFASSDDGGKTFSANKKVVSDICPCCKVSMASGPDGKLYMSWRQVLPEGTRHIAVASSTDRGATFSAANIVSDDKWKLNACPVSGASMATDNNGALNIAWYTAGDAGPAGVYSSRSTDGGLNFEQRTSLNSNAASGTPVLLPQPGTEEIICVVPLKEDSVMIGCAGPGKTINDAGYPSAVISGGKTVVAFVRNSGEKRVVMMAR